MYSFSSDEQQHFHQLKVSGRTYRDQEGKTDTYNCDTCVQDNVPVKKIMNTSLHKEGKMVKKHQRWHCIPRAFKRIEFRKQTGSICEAYSSIHCCLRFLTHSCLLAFTCFFLTHWSTSYCLPPTYQLWQLNRKLPQHGALCLPVAVERST